MEVGSKALHHRVCIDASSLTSFVKGAASVLRPIWRKRQSNKQDELLWKCCARVGQQDFGRVSEKVL